MGPVSVGVDLTTAAEWMQCGAGHQHHSHKLSANELSLSPNTDPPALGVQRKKEKKHYVLNLDIQSDRAATAHLFTNFLQKAKSKSLPVENIKSK